MDRKRIIINFKNTPEELKLYEELKKHSSISGYIKDVLKGIVNTATIPENINPAADTVEINDNEQDLLDLDDINSILDI